MTWERFELTGAVEDYLSYKGITRERAENVRREKGESRRAEAEHGTEDHSDRPGAGGLSPGGL